MGKPFHLEKIRSWNGGRGIESYDEESAVILFFRFLTF